MKSYSLSHLADATLLRDLAVLVTQDRVTTASLLAYLAEVDERRLYVGKAYPSMYLYCVRELRMSEDTAFKRIRTARAARRFPEIFPALADGRLNLNTVVLLAPHLIEDNARELLVAAEHKRRAEIEQLIAARFPQPDLPTLMAGFAPVIAGDPLTPARVEPSGLQLGPDPAVICATSDFRQLAARPVATMVGIPVQPLATTQVDPNCAHRMTGPSGTQLAPERGIEPRARIAPLSPGRFALQVTVDQETHDLLRYAQALLGHSVPSGDIAQVLRRALEALVQKLEKQKFAKGARSRPRSSAPNGVARTISTRLSAHPAPGSCSTSGSKPGLGRRRLARAQERALPGAHAAERTRTRARPSSAVPHDPSGLPKGQNGPRPWTRRPKTKSRTGDLAHPGPMVVLRRRL